MIRPVQAITFDGVVPGAPPTDAPELTWIAPTDVLISEDYQRGLSEKSLRLIRRIVENFDWRRFKPPIVAWCETGLECLDGQHSLIAAASHPSIDKVPVLVVEARERSDRAGAFVGHNRDRLAITVAQMHHSAVIAGDAEALRVDTVCRAAGVSIMKHNPGREWRPGETIVVSAVRNLVLRCGDPLAIEVLRIAVQAKCAPISADALKAIEMLLVGVDYADQFDLGDLAKTIETMGAQAEKEAKLFGAEHCVPRWRGLVGVWFRNVKKRRKAVVPVAPTDSPGIISAQVAPKPPAAVIAAARAAVPIDSVSFKPRPNPHPPRGVPIRMAGEPEPGRSALDQRLAAEGKRR